jgi:hypothetical protein
LGKNNSKKACSAADRSPLSVTRFTPKCETQKTTAGAWLMNIMPKTPQKGRMESSNTGMAVAPDLNRISSAAKAALYSAHNFSNRVFYLVDSILP